MGSWGSGPPPPFWGSGLPPPFWGTPKLHKEGNKPSRMCAQICRVLDSSSYLDPTPPFRNPVSAPDMQMSISVWCRDSPPEKHISRSGSRLPIPKVLLLFEYGGLGLGAHAHKTKGSGLLNTCALVMCNL